ncbi:MAG: tripartite tricarboxylate transporter TctB family protein [Rhodobacteraceae bacterium]|nr:tripartite tricarboxylate transporter TctB family protein [Paracoccaceae bacterium]
MSDRTQPGRAAAHPGNLVFAVVFLAISGLLLSMLGEQTRAVRRVALTSQPWFWPAISLGAMTGFGALHLAFVLWERHRLLDLSAEAQEAGIWLRALEYSGWFLVYAWVVPLGGYLPTTILFALLLTWRAGYRERGLYLAAGGLSVAVVVIFKGFLGVRIPGGAVYEVLPPTLRNFMIVYF